MSSIWSSLVFTSPWILLALIALPLIWWMLRATPPSPKKVGFPAMALIRGLQPKEVVASKTPWWLLLLRLSAVAALIVAIAGPLLSPESNERDGALLLVVDDTAQAANGWTARAQRMNSLLSQAQRLDRAVYVATTAVGTVAVDGPLTAGAAKTKLKTLLPKAIPADRKGLTEMLKDTAFPDEMEVVWLADELADELAGGLGSETNHDAEFEGALNDLGGLTIYTRSPETQKLTPHVRLLEPVRDGRRINFNVERLNKVQTPQQVRLVATDINGRLVTEKAGLIVAGEKVTTISLDLPRELRNRLYRVEVEGQTSVNAVQLMDERWQTRSIGLIASNRAQVQEGGQGAGANQQANRFLSATFYIQTALDSFADVSVGRVGDLLDKPRSVLFWPDSSQLGEKDLTTLEEWVTAGGTLVRFAGPNLANTTLSRQLEADPLLPVELRAGNRSIGGALDWAEAARIESFSPAGNFSGLPVSKEVEIKRQVLAEPSLDLDQKSWATLEDGTPLVTAVPKGEGKLVFFHTTASPRWSNLSLSGLFVDMLRKIVQDAATSGQQQATQVLKPISLLDGFGRSRGPQGQDLPLKPEALLTHAITAENPPGLYGSGEERRALNYANSARSFEALSFNAKALSFEGAVELSLKHWLLIAAFILLIADLLIRLIMSGSFARNVMRSAVSVAALMLFVGAFALAPQQLQAQTSGKETKQEARERQAILETRLAYIRTGNSRADATSRAGLFGLTRWITTKSSTELGLPAGINLGTDELLFYPLVYWPIRADQKPLPADIAAKINDYMAAGGMLLIDTRDAGANNNNQGNRALIRALRGLSIPPLVPVPEAHVLTKSFYLLSWYPGRWAQGDVWVAATATSDEEAGLINDGVSPVVIGGMDWAAAWAIDESGSPLFPVVPGLNRQREFSYRFGMNLVMYALAGNYKADQVHVRSILDRVSPPKEDPEQDQQQNKPKSEGAK